MGGERRYSVLCKGKLPDLPPGFGLDASSAALVEAAKAPVEVSPSELPPSSRLHAVTSQKHRCLAEVGAAFLARELSPLSPAGFHTAPLPPGWLGRLNAAEQCAGSASKHRVGVARLVSAALPGWHEADLDTVTVDDLGGLGSGLVYKVAAERADPPVVAIHSCRESPERDARVEDAWHLFSRAGMTFRRLAQGDDWYITLTGSESLSKHGQFWNPREVARLLARIHALPTDWYEPHRSQLQARYAALRAVPEASHVWRWACNDAAELDSFGEAGVRRWLEQLPLLVSPYAVRPVTSHGDFHLGNMVRSHEGTVMIDNFAHTCVTYAVEDLACAMVTLSLAPSDQRDFAAAYLGALSTLATDEVVDELLLDAQIYSLVQWYGPLSPLTSSLPGGSTEAEAPRSARAKRLLDIAVQARGDGRLRQTVLQQGLLGMPDS